MGARAVREGEGMRIDLTRSQMHLLQPLVDKVREASESGEPGMLMAQIYPGDRAMFCGFIAHAKSEEVQKVVNTADRVGATSSSIADRCAKAYEPLP